MTTKFIGIKEFRQNLASITNTSRIKNIRFIVLRKNIPVLQVTPLDEKDFALEKLNQEIALAKKHIKEGKCYTQEEIMKKFGLL